MKKILSLFAILSLTVLSAAPAMVWDGGEHHKTEGANIIIKAWVQGAKLRNVPVKPGKYYRLHYTACGIGDSGASAMFYNLQISPSPRVDGAFLIQDVRNVPQKAFQNFSIPENAGYDTIDLLFEVKNRKGQVRISDVSLEEIKFDPRDNWQVKVLSPHYRRTFFAGDKERILHAEIITDNARWYDAELLDKNGHCVEFTKGALKNGRGSVILDLKDLPVGEYSLIVLLTTDKGDLQKSITYSITIADKAKMEVLADKKHNFYINGKPFFPVFYYYEMMEDAMIYEAARNGVNICIMGFNHEEHTLRQLDRLHRNGMMGMIFLEQRGHINESDRLEEFKKDMASRITQKVKDHPALFGYIIADEPMWRGIPVERMKEYYEFLKSFDPHRPLWLNEAPRNEEQDLKLYAEYADIYGNDIYPVPYPAGHSHLTDRTPSCVDDYTARNVRIVDGRKPVWMVLQGNSWSDYYEKPEDIYPYPTYDEARYMALSAILAGSNGYALYSPEKNRSIQYQKDLFAISTELQKISGLFFHAERKKDAEVSNPKVRCGIWTYQGNTYGILVNNSAWDETASIKLPANVKMKVFADGRTIDPENIRLKPFASIIWGNAPLPPSVWRQIPENPLFKGKKAFERYINRRNDLRDNAWKKAGITPKFHGNDRNKK